MDLNSIQSCLSGPWLVLALAMLGMAVGILAGLLGIGGAFVIVPLLNILLGIPYDLAVGSSLCFVLATSATGWFKHWRLGNSSIRAVAIVGAGAAVGGVCGAIAQGRMQAIFSVQQLTIAMHCLFILLLIAAILMSRVEDGVTPPRGFLMQRFSLGPRISIPQANLAGLSATAMAAMGLIVGVICGLMGVGGGVLLIPALLRWTGLPMKIAVGTSMGIVLLNALTGTAMYGLRGQVNLWIVVPLVIASSLGAAIGAGWSKKFSHAALRRGFIMLVTGMLVCIVVDLARKICNI